MSVYMQSTLEIAPTGMPRFLQTMEKVVPILEGHGWKLVAAFMHYTGRLHTVVDVWQLDDFNHYERALHALMADPVFVAEIGPALAETVLKETVVLGHAVPYLKSGDAR